MSDIKLKFSTKEYIDGFIVCNEPTKEYIEKLDDQIKWLEFNLEQANAEVRKGREIIEFVQQNDPGPDLSSDKYRDAYWRVRARLQEFYSSYID